MTDEHLVHSQKVFHHFLLIVSFSIYSYYSQCTKMLEYFVDLYIQNIYISFCCWWATSNIAHFCFITWNNMHWILPYIIIYWLLTYFNNINMIKIQALIKRLELSPWIKIICPITVRISELLAGIIPKIIHNLWLYP